MKKFLSYYLLIFIFSFCVHNASAQSLIPCTFICATTEISGDVTLQWIESDETCGSFVEYIIYASNNIDGPYTILDFIFFETSTNYTHVGADGSTTTWYYYIEALYDCPGYTIISSDTLDNLDPAAPEIDYVTVDVGGVNIFWFPSTSAKTSAYIIYRDEGGFTAIDTVYGRFTTTYYDLTASASTQVETYTIAAMDACDNVGPLSINEHHTVYMIADQEGCSGDMNLSWNFYDTWAAGVSEYQVWLDINFTGATLLASLSPSTNTYTYTGLNDSDDYTFTIYAVRSDNTAISHSNTWSFNLNVVVPAEYNVVRNATVTAANTIDVAWYPDNTADLRDYVVQRSEDGVSYSTIYSNVVDDPITSPDIFTDGSADPNSKSYSYKIITTDSCGIDFTSGAVKTILLSGIANENFTNALTWNAFEITNATILEYNIYRNEVGIMNLLTSVDASVTNYTDDVAPIITLTDSACYFVEASFQLITATPTINEVLTSKSNTICFEQDPKIYVPNAIIPGSANGIFKPFIIFGEDDGFSMQIFNRYGEMIFESFDVNEGWDGKFKGDIVPTGAYAYLISFTGTNGEVVKKKGNVSVIQ